MTATTFPSALAALLHADAGRPLVTFYDDATGERIELSVTTYANWVAKTAGLAQDELDAERGGLVLVDLPTHWLGAVWLGAAWSLGLAVTDDPALADEADLVVCGPDGVATYASHSVRVPVVALSLRPLGGRFTEALPGGVTDYGAVVLAQPDLFVAYDAPEGEDAAWRSPTGTSSQVDLLTESAAAGVVETGGRLLTDVNPCTRVGAGTLLGPLLAGAGVVWVRHPDEDAWERRADQERATSRLRA
ncbi:TIGR03089 family protein [soil metagenome]